MKKRVFVLTLFLLLASIVQAASIHYDGLTLHWEGTNTAGDEIKYTYLYEKINDKTFNQRDILENKEQPINILNRKFVGGKDNGTYTSHWIPTNLEVGDKIQINDQNYTVDSINDNLFLQDFGSIKAILVSYSKFTPLKTIDEVYTETDIDYNVDRWYSKISGILLKAHYTQTSTKTWIYSDSVWHPKTNIAYELMETNVDMDKDGLTDYKELVELATDPTMADSDSDGLGDKEELDFGTDPAKADTDDDGLSDKTELDDNLDPLDPDMDDDGLSDGLEVQLGTNPSLGDTDGDGISDKAENDQSTNPTKSDSDDDGLSDSDEMAAGSDPLKKDSDEDGLGDFQEIEFGSNPLAADEDGDGLSDLREFELKTNPKLSDTDNDMWNDKIDIARNSVLLPNGLFVLIVLIVIAGILFLVKGKKKKTAPK